MVPTSRLLKNSSRRHARFANPSSALRILAVAMATAAKPRLDLESARRTGHQNEFFNSENWSCFTVRPSLEVARASSSDRDVTNEAAVLIIAQKVEKVSKRHFFPARFRTGVSRRPNTFVRQRLGPSEPHAPAPRNPSGARAYHEA
jgi:hypothetical protein